MDGQVPSQSSSRPCKVRRTDEGDNMPIAIASVKKKFELYLDTLDDNGLDHVAKFIRAKAWPSFPRVEDITPLLVVHGQFLNYISFLMIYYSIRIAIHRKVNRYSLSGTMPYPSPYLA